ncbi:MAG: S-layer protein [Candidatus Aenigmatarchaeota archaeon]
MVFSGVSGKASPTVPVVYGEYKVYADTGVTNEWAHVYVMKGETKVGDAYIEVGEAPETIGDLDIKLLGVVALPMEATVVRADLVVGPTGKMEAEYIEGDKFPGTEVWEFSDIIVDGSNLLRAINITYKPEEEADNYLKLGEKLTVPNNYVEIGFKGFKVNKFATLTVKTGTVSLYQTATSTSPIASYKNRPAIVLESKYPIFNNKRSTTAYLVLNASDDVIGLGYLDPRENKAVLDSEDDTTISFGAEFGSTSMNIEFDVSSLQNLTLTVGSEKIEANYTFKTGTTDTVALGERLKAEESDVKVSWDADVSGEWEYDTVSDYGLIVKSVETNAKNDKVVIEIPEDQQKAVVYVGKLGAAAGEEYVVYKPVVNPVARLDTELTSVDKTKNLVSVGGPCVNEISYNALKAAGVVTVAYPACGADSSIPENAAIIRVVEDYPATGKFTVVVAGWEATNTRVASAALMQYKEKLAGQPAAVKVSGTIEAPVITPL